MMDLLAIVENQEKKGNLVMMENLVKMALLERMVFLVLLEGVEAQ